MIAANSAPVPLEINRIGPVDPAAAPVALPRNWYILAESREVRRGRVVARTIGDREVVLFRTESGNVAAFDAHCAHMGCHLRHASVAGETLRCALHFRHIDREGRFLTPDGAPSRDLVQPVYPVAERYGAIFVHVGGEPERGLPEPDIIAAGAFMARPAGEFRTSTPWHGLIANGCDMEHLLSVHDRRLKQEPVVTRPDAWSYRIAYRTEVIGRTLADRIMKRMARNDIRASMTVISGTTMMVQSEAGPTPSVFMLSMCPQEDGGTLVRGIIGLEAGRSRLFDAIKLRLAQWLFKSFLAKDFGVFEGLEWHPPMHEHSSGDRFTRQLHAYFLELRDAGSTGRAGGEPRKPGP
ncbi:MAG: Rieske 2Fe-2S domain-containing protein [Oricola sp.]